MAEIPIQCDLYEEEVTTDLGESSVVTQLTTTQKQSEVDFSKCVICKNDTAEHTAVVGVGLSTILEHLRLAKRYDVIQNIELNPGQQILLHLSCRRQLANDSNKAANQLKNQDNVQQRKRTRSSASGFSFKDMCFLCGGPIAGSKDVRKVTSGSEFDQKIQQGINERGPDEWAIAVQGRLSYVSDLFAADAVYHKKCHTRFLINLPHTPAKKSEADHKI